VPWGKRAGGTGAYASASLVSADGPDSFAIGMPQAEEVSKPALAYLLPLRHLGLPSKRGHAPGSAVGCKEPLARTVLSWQRFEQLWASTYETVAELLL